MREGGETGALSWCLDPELRRRNVPDDLMGRLSTLGLNDPRSSRRNMMGKSENASGEYKGMIRFTAAKRRCVGKACISRRSSSSSLLLSPSDVNKYFRGNHAGSEFSSLNLDSL